MHKKMIMKSWKTYFGKITFTAGSRILETLLAEAPADLSHIHPVIIFFGIELIHFRV
ncbi:MAG: hypothetical protein A4E58_02248 [Syntrophorhabdus sp. PtaB.Bin006]|nr:MAG: hypothetical protein A4E58_02248 [Syntrophorhabdus sp. PtaB.Bin006]